MKNIIKLIGIFTLMSSASIMAAEGNYETIAIGRWGIQYNWDS